MTVNKTSPFPLFWKIPCRGGVLLDALIGVILFTVVGTAVLAGLSTMQRSGASTERQSIAENLARNQMEQVFILPYQVAPSTYPPIPVPPHFQVVASATEYVPGDPNIERITVVVSFDQQPLLTVETLRTKG